MSGLVPSPRWGRRSKGRQRLLWRVAAVAVAVVCASVGGILIYVQVATRWGIEALGRGDLVTAERWFRSASSLDWVEPWRGPFNTGVALYAQREWPAAQEQFDLALTLTPVERTCMVALNLAWSHEAEGDQFMQQGSPSQALVAWQRAETVAALANCDYAQEGEDDTSPSASPSQSPQAQEGLESDEGTPQDADGDASGENDGDDGQEGGEGQSEDDTAGESEEGEQQSGGEEGTRTGTGGTGGTPQQQQQETLDRLETKSGQARQEMDGAGDDGSDQDGTDGAGSAGARLEELEQQNKAAQQARDQGGGLGDKQAVEGRTW